MQITETFKPTHRNDWRNWLARNHATAREIWMLLDDRADVYVNSELAKTLSAQ